MGNNNKSFEKIAAISALFIAAATLWGFLITYLNEVGILKYYDISTRYIRLDIHIFAMSWRAFVILVSVATICVMFYIFLDERGKAYSYSKGIFNIIIKIFICICCPLRDKKLDFNYSLKYISWLTFVCGGFLILGFLYLKLCIEIFKIYYGWFIFFILILLLYLTYFVWASEKNKAIRIISIWLITITIFIGGMETSYLHGHNFAKEKDEYYIVNGKRDQVVILENNEFILWSNYYECSKTLDSTFYITYYSSADSIDLKQVKLGPIKRRNDAR